MACCICTFFRRTFLYQILIVVAALKFKNIFRYHKDFYNRIKNFLTSINLESWDYYLPENKEATHKGFLIALIVLASISIFRKKNYFRFCSGIGCILLAFLYHNPLIKMKELKEKNVPFTWPKTVEGFGKILPDMEFLLYICIAFAMFGNICEEDVCKVKKEEEKIVEEEKKEIPNGAETHKRQGKHPNNQGKTNKKKKKD